MAVLTPKYFHIGSAAPTTENPVDGGELVKDDTKKNTSNFNPIFNFDQTFVDNLQTISQVELAQSVPFVSLRTRDSSGEILQDLNLTFFHRQADFDNIANSELRYPDRPLMSLVSLDAKTTQASGYMYYTELTFRIKIHSPDALKNTSILALLIPEMPLEVEYGWNSPSDFLGANNREKMLFQVRNYNISLDTTGQIDLSVEGMAFNERINNVYVGDTGQDLSGETLTSGIQFDSLSRAKAQLEERLAYLAKLQANPDSGPNDFSLVKGMAETYQNVEKRVRGAISKEFARLKSQLVGKDGDKEFGIKKVKVLTFHDILYTLCNDSFKAMSELFIGATEFRVIYGNFNENCGDLSGKSIAEFPIIKQKFHQALQRKRTSGQFVITIEGLLNLMIDDFIENEEYLKTLISDSKAEEFVQPQVNFNFSNRGGIVEMSIIDIKADIPLTTKDLMPDAAGPSADVEKAALDAGLPIIRLGHANSFIKKINLTQMTDQYMKAALIERMHRDRLESARSNIVPGASLESKPTNPLHLPLKGSASVLGHTQWKPFRSFYLSAGLFLVDAVYKITSVRHTLKAGSFDTTIEFVYH